MRLLHKLVLNKVNYFAIFFIALSILVFPSNPNKASAGTCTWVGTTNGNWNTGSNWTGSCSGGLGQPDDNDTLVFPSNSSNMTMNNDISGLDVSGMDFQNSAYDLSGNSIGVSGTIETNTYKPRVNVSITLNSDIVLKTAIYSSGINLNTHTLTFETGNPSTDVEGVISGNGSITVQGIYLTNFSGSNTFTGDITVEAGAALQALNNSALGNSSNILSVGDNGFFALGGGHTISNNMIFGNSSAISNYGTGNEISGDITGPVSGIMYFYPSGTDTLTLSGKLTGYLMALGSDGNLILSGNSANSIDVFLIQAGILTLSKNSGVAVGGQIVVGQGAGSTPIYLIQTKSDQIANDTLVTVKSDGIWQLNGNNESIGDLNIDGGRVETDDGDLTINNLLFDYGDIDSGSGSLTLNNDITIDSTTSNFTTIEGSKLILNSSNPTVEVTQDTLGYVTIQSNIWGSGDLHFYGLITMLSGDNSNFTGNIYIGDSDTPSIVGISSSDSPLGDSSGKTIVADGSTLYLSNVASPISENIDVYGTGYGNIMGTDLGALHGAIGVTNQLSGTITLKSNSRFGTSEDVGFVFSGEITGNYNLTLSGAGDPVYGFAFTGNNSYVGNTTIDDCGLFINDVSNNSLPDYNDIVLTGNSQIGFYSNESTGSISGNGTLYVDHNVFLAMAYVTGDKTFSGSIQGSGDIMKYGTSNLILTGNSPDFTGHLYNSEGPITVNGSISSAIADIQGGTFAGIGTLGNTLAENGWISPGNSPGVLHINGNLSLNNMDYINIQLNGSKVGSGYDQIDVTGDVSINNANLQISANKTPQDGVKYIILKSVGTITGTFTNQPNYSTINVKGKELTVVYTANQVYLISLAKLSLSSLSASPSSIKLGDSTSIYAFWSGTGTTPTGIVTFMEGSSVLGNVTLKDGKATLTVSNLTVGTHYIYVKYMGDSVYNSAVSSPIAVVVNDNSVDTQGNSGNKDEDMVPNQVQKYRLGVYVTDQQGKPVPNSVVVLSPGNLNGVTNESGRFDFVNLDKGEYTLKVSALGIEKTQNINIDSDNDIKIVMSSEKIENKKSNKSLYILISLIIITTFVVYLLRLRRSRLLVSK